VNIPWQIKYDIARARVADTSRAARYAHRNAENHHRPMHRIAAVLRWAFDRLARAVPRQALRRRVVATPVADFGPRDLKLAIVALDEPGNVAARALDERSRPGKVA